MSTVESGMSNRMSPDEMARICDAQWFLSELRRAGWVVVHPDDVPPKPQMFDMTWNDCRRHVFGENA